MEEIKYICVVDTVYSLSLYLLYQPFEAYDKTLFFVGNVIPENISSKFKHVFRIDYKTENFYSKINLICLQLKIRKYRDIIRHSTIYAQDHIAFSGWVIGTNDYVLLEDAPNIFTIYKTISFMNPAPLNSFKARLDNKVFKKLFLEHSLGRNQQCKSIIYTSPTDSDSELLTDKEAIYVDLKKIWNESDREKKRFIHSLFDIDEDIFNTYKNNNIIIFSQPLSHDCKLSDEEICDIYSPYIEKYKNDGIIIKPHPRDTFNYSKIYPNITIMNTKAPMQILSAMGLSFKKAITVCSSAISSMDSDCEIIWIGTSANPKILAVYGDIKCPK